MRTYQISFQILLIIFLAKQLLVTVFFNFYFLVISCH